MCLSEKVRAGEGFLSLIQCKHRCRNHPNASLSALFFFFFCFLATPVERVLEIEGNYIKERLCGVKPQQRFGSIYWSWQTDTTFTFMTFLPKGNVFFTDISRKGREKLVFIENTFLRLTCFTFFGKEKKTDCRNKKKTKSIQSWVYSFFDYVLIQPLLLLLKCPVKVWTLNLVGECFGGNGL